MGLFKKVFGRNGFFDKIGKGIDKATGGLSGKLVDGIKKTAYSIPVVGPIAKIAVEDVGGAIVGNAKAAHRDGSVNAAKVKKTLKAAGATATDAVANAVSVGIAETLQKETGKKMAVAQIQGSTVPTRDHIGADLQKQTFMQRLKSWGLSAWSFIEEHKTWFIVGASLLILPYVAYKLFFSSKKWRA